MTTRVSACTCTITRHERQEDRGCPVHFPAGPLGIGPIEMAPLADRVASYLRRVGDAIHTCHANCSKPEHLVYEMHQEIDRLQSSATASGERAWRPIESAPANTPVLVSGFNAEQQGRWVVLAINDGSGWFRCYLDGRHGGAECYPPSHWIPAPKEPT